MKIYMQLVRLLQTLVACVRCSHHLWHIWLLSKPTTHPKPFKPWLNPVSHRATPSSSSHWRSKPDWVRAVVFDLAVALPGSGYRTIAGCSIPVLGTIDHGSRAVLHLQSIATYNSLILLGRLVLKMIGVRQQFTDLGSPWQNGRVERFWRTLKSELQTKAARSRLNGIAVQTRMKFASVQAMRSLLEAFKQSYKAYRLHQSLGGAIPATVWNGQVKDARLRLRVKATASTHMCSRKARAPPA